MDDVRVLDGINRWRFAKDPEVMAEWEAARHLPPSRPADQPVQAKGVTPGDPGRVAPAALGGSLRLHPLAVKQVPRLARCSG